MDDYIKWTAKDLVSRECWVKFPDGGGLDVGYFGNDIHEFHDGEIDDMCQAW